jgi:hypothetical protein
MTKRKRRKAISKKIRERREIGKELQRDERKQ